MESRFDWKIAVVLVGHLLAVGAMYGRITNDVSRTNDVVVDLKHDISDLRKTVDNHNATLAAVLASRESSALERAQIRERISKLEDAIWMKKK